MMHVTSGGYTRNVSSQVATALAYLADHPDKFVLITVVETRQASGSQLPAEHDTDYWVRLDDDRPHTNLADGRQLIRCKTKGGRRLDVILAASATRDVEPALVIIGED